MPSTNTGILRIKWAIAPFFNTLKDFLIQIADDAWAHAAAPQRFENIFYPTHGNTSQVHFHRSLFNRACAAAVLDYRCFKRNMPQF